MKNSIENYNFKITTPISAFNIDIYVRWKHRVSRVNNLLNYGYINNSIKALHRPNNSTELE